MSAKDDVVSRNLRADRGPYPAALGSISVPLIVAEAERLDAAAVGGVSPTATAIYALLDYGVAALNRQKELEGDRRETDPLRILGEWLAGVLGEEDWPAAERYLNAAIAKYGVPA